MDEATLEHYQRELLTRLRAGQQPATILAALRSDPALASLHEYLGGIDPDALVVAARLIARWSRD